MRFTILGAATLLLACPIGRGQTTGTIAGRVADSAGTVLAGVTIDVTSPSLQGSRAASTDAGGSYHVPAVPPGTYSVKASRRGFRTAEKSATVTLDGTTTVDLVLQLSSEERVVVSGEAPLIDQTSTTTGTSYSSRVVSHLPVARNYADIVRANPGVDTDRGETQGRSLALTVYGATSAENQWTIDGVTTTSVFKGTQGKVLNNEFVETVEVKTGGYQAEYGRALGGIVSVVTKSGGNAFHGDGFAYYDSADTAAHQEFQPGDSTIAAMRIVDGQRVEYGVDLGGFLIKDRLWFFGAYDRARVDGQVSRVDSWSDVSRDARFPFHATDNFYSGKLTWNAASSTSLVGSVFADPTTSSGAAGADPRRGLGSMDVEPIVSLDPSTWSSTRKQGGTDYGLRLNQLLGPRIVATLQGSFHRERDMLTPPDGIRYEDDRCADGTPKVPCAFPDPPLSITGGYGYVRGFFDHNDSSRRQFGGNLTVFEGNHEIKAGGDYMDGRTDAIFFITGGQSVYIGNEYGQLYYLHQFYAVSRTDATPVDHTKPHAQVIDYGAYVQDSWRLSQGLTVNLGLRWDGELARNHLGETVLRFNDEWQPRLGVTWDPWRDGATKVYASVGRFYYALPTTTAAWLFGNFTILQTYNTDPVSVAQDASIFKHPDVVFVDGGGPYGDEVDRPAKAPYQDEVTAGVERLFGPTLTVGLKATYRRLGRALEQRCDLFPSPASDNSSCAIVNPGSSGKLAQGDAPTCSGLFDAPDYQCPGGTGPATPPARRLYRGIELLARKSIGQSLWLQASYVYSSLRGNYDGLVNENGRDATGGAITGTFSYPADWHNGYGILALDRPHRLRFDGFYVTPWQLGIGLQAFVESGAPLNTMGYFNNCGCVFLVPRGSAGRLPPLWEANLTLSYPIAVGPTIVTLQAYVFNLFNKQIAVSRNDTWSDTPPENYSAATIYDPNQQQTNAQYGKVIGRQEPRQLRAAVKVSF